MLIPGDDFRSFPESALDGSIVDRFETIASRHPDRLAVSDLDRSLTYAELRQLVARVAINLERPRLDREGPIAILMPSDARFPAAILSVLAAGRSHVPLDVTHPVERNRLIAESAGAAAVLSISGLFGDAESLFAADMPVLDFEQLSKFGHSEPRSRATAADIAQIVYTSGSTGKPKGVYNSHRNCLHDVYQLTNRMFLSRKDSVVLLYSPSVIGGLRLMFGALLNGAALHVLSPRLLLPTGLVREIQARSITVFGSVPALFRQIVETLGEGEKLDTIRVARLGGDRVDWSDAELFRRACLPMAALVVSLGSTECSSHYAEWVVDDTLDPRGSRLPVGSPMQDLTVEILDENSVAVADGEVGEFVVSSPYLALGYWRAPELTAAAFAPVPGDPLSRTFRTGDMGLRRPDGLLEFTGRKDHQIKLRGHRIELAEIETALRACAGVGDAAAVVRRDPKGAPRSLVAYVEGARNHPRPQPATLLSMLSRSLPRFMLPGEIVVVDSLPRLPSLKIDRSRLAEIAASTPQDRQSGRDDPLVHEIALLFERILGVSQAGGDDSFASLGGDSLKAVTATIELEERYGVAMSMDLFEETATIGALADRIRSASK